MAKIHFRTAARVLGCLKNSQSNYFGNQLHQNTTRLSRYFAGFSPLISSFKTSTAMATGATTTSKLKCKMVSPNAKAGLSCDRNIDNLCEFLLLSSPIHQCTHINTPRFNPQRQVPTSKEGITIAADFLRSGGFVIVPCTLPIHAVVCIY